MDKMFLRLEGPATGWDLRSGDETSPLSLASPYLESEMQLLLG